MRSAPTAQVSKICTERTTGGRANGAGGMETGASPKMIHVEMAGTTIAIPVTKAEPQRTWSATLEICGTEMENAALSQGIGGAPLPP